MADNVTANAGSGGAVFATDDIGSVHYPRSKVVWGADGVANDASAANPLPVVQTGTPALPTGASTAANQATEIAALAAIQAAVEILDNTVAGSELQVDVVSSALPTGAATAANQATGNTSLGTIAGAVAGTEMQVDVVAALPAGGNTIGAVNLAQYTPVTGRLPVDPSGVTSPVSLASVPSHPVTNAGTFAVQESGAALTALQLIDNLVLAEDSVAGSGDPGVAILAVRRDAAAAGGADGDYVNLSTDSTGALRVTGGGGGTQYAEDAAHTTGDTGTMALGVRRDANTSLVGTDGDYAPFQVDANGGLKVSIIAGAGSGGTASTDDGAFTVGSGSGTPIMGLADETTPDAVDEGDVGVVRMTLSRGLHVNLRDASGNEVAVGGGTQYDEDTAHVSGDKLTMAGVVRRDTAASGVGADGDRDTLSTDNTGRLWVNGSGVTQPISAASLPLPTGAATAANQTTGNTSLGTIAGAVSGTEMQVDVVAALPAGNNNIGDVDIASMPNVTLAAGTNTNEVVGDAAHDAAAAGNPLLQGGYASAAAPSDVSADGDAVRAWYLRNGAAASVLTAAGALIGGDATNGLDVDVTRVSGTVTVGGVAAHDAAVSGNPVRVGGRAGNADYTAVANGDTADFLTDLNGKQVVLPYAVPERFVSGVTAAITGTSDTSVIAAGGAGLRNYITQVLVTNSHATVGTVVELKDNTTVIYRGYAAALGGGFAVTFPTPLRCADNVAFQAANVTTGSNTYVSASGYRAP